MNRATSAGIEVLALPAAVSICIVLKDPTKITTKLPTRDLRKRVNMILILVAGITKVEVSAHIASPTLGNVALFGLKAAIAGPSH